MPTLYQRLQIFYSHDKFRFKERDKNRIGKRLSLLWQASNEGITPPRVESKEDTGTYQVFDYPEEFTTMIDQMIRNVHREILDAAKERRQKKLCESPPARMYVESQDGQTTEKKPRKRISAKPAPVWENPASYKTKL